MNSGQTISKLKSTLDLASIPKVELHRHLEGALRLSTLKELARKSGIEVPPNEEACREKFLVTQPMKDLATVLHKFLMTQSVLSSEEVLSRICFEAIEDACNEGIRILELRYSPTFIMNNHSNLSAEKIVRGFEKGLKLAQELPIAVGFIGIIQRTRPLDEAQRMMDFFIEHKEHFVGVDLADNEDGFDPKPFAPVFEKAKKQGLSITIHAGEVNSPISAENVKSSIEFLGATRIGHGLQIIKDEKIIQFVKERGVALELCPTSNWLTNAVPSVAEHPFVKLMKQGVITTLNSDDPGLFGINLTTEYEVMLRHFNFTENEFSLINDFAAQASFLPLVKKQKYWPRPIHILR